MANTKIPIELSSTPGIVDNSNATAITIDSSENVGIGTTSPSTFSSGADNLVVGTGSGDNGITLYSGTTSVSRLHFADGTSAGGQYDGFITYDHNGQAMSFGTGATGGTDVTINSSGNVGIGATPPSGVRTKIKGLAEATNLATSATSAALFIEPYSGSSWGLGIGSISGQKQYIQGVSAAGDSSRELLINPYGGNVGIGTDSPSSGLHVQGANNIASTLTLTNTAPSPDNTWTFTPQYNSGDLTISDDGTERMRIDSSGNVGIGTSSPDSDTRLHVVSSGATASTHIQAGTVAAFERSQSTAGAYLAVIGANNGASALHLGDSDDDDVGNITYNHSTNFMAFSTAGTERMRITSDSDGSILLGKTAASIDAQGHWFRDNGESFHTIVNTDNTLHIWDTTNDVYRFYVSGAGTINATSTSITAISDERLKENIVDLETGLSEVMSLQPRRFDWKNGDGENVAGFIAQEVETVLPDLIGDYKHEELEDAKAVRMGDMIPTLVKAIQEQQAQIEALQSEINELKNS